MTATALDPIAPRKHADREPRWPFPAGIVATTVAVTALAWSIITIGLGATIHGPTFDNATPEPVGVGSAATATLVAGLAGWVLLAAIERWAKRPTRIWTPIAVGAALLSLGGPLSGTGVTAGDRVALMTAHVLVAAIYIPLMRQTATD